MLRCLSETMTKLSRSTNVLHIFSKNHAHDASFLESTIENVRGNIWLLPDNLWKYMIMEPKHMIMCQNA